jgi:small subunit ribosomal protein S20
MAEDATKTKAKVKLPTAQKRHLQNLKRAKKNKSRHAENNTVRLALEKTIKENKADAPKSLQLLYSKVDKALKHGIIKANKAARIKSRSARKVNAAK